MNPWNFFNTILVINLPERTDRLVQFEAEAVRVGMSNVYKTAGIKHANPMLGFNEAQHNALLACEGNSLILEDDVVFSNIGHLGAALYELPYDWDLCYLGGNLQGTDLCSWDPPKHYSQHLRRVTQAWTTHAIAYSESGLKKILADWDFTSGRMYDDWLREAVESKLNAYVVNPMVADQRPGFSDIWNVYTNYGFFEGGNNLMART